MPIPKKWSKFNKENLKEVPEVRGAYELANRQKRIVDQGGSDNATGVRGRLQARLRDKKPPTAVYFRYEPAGWLSSGISREADHAEKFRKKYGRKPRYTKRSPKKRGFF